MKKKKNEPTPCLTTEEAVGEFYDTVWSYALFLADRDRTASEEITQNVFLCLIEKWEKISKENIGGWLFGVTRMKYREYVRAVLKDKKNLTFPVDTEEDGLSDPLDNVPVFDDYFTPDDGAIEEAKERILGELTGEERTLFDRRFKEKMSYEDISRELGVSENSVRMKLFRLRKKVSARAEKADL